MAGPCNRRAGRTAGFTLVEMMVVLALIGLAASIVVLTLPGDSDRLRTETDRLASRITAVRDLAIIENRPAALWVSASGHGVEQLGRVGWEPAQGRALAPHRWAVLVTVVDDSGADQARIQFDMAGLTDQPLRLTLQAGDAASVIRVGANGAVRIGAGND